MPTPGKKEKRKDFISRCIPIVINEGTAKDNKQASAICFSMWRQHLKKKRSKGEKLTEEEVLELKKIDEEEQEEQINENEEEMEKESEEENEEKRKEKERKEALEAIEKI